MIVTLLDHLHCAWLMYLCCWWTHPVTLVALHHRFIIIIIQSRSKSIFVKFSSQNISSWFVSNYPVYGMFLVIMKELLLLSLLLSVSAIWESDRCSQCKLLSDRPDWYLMWRPHLVTFTVILLWRDWYLRLDCCLVWSRLRSWYFYQQLKSPFQSHNKQSESREIIWKKPP